MPSYRIHLRLPDGREAEVSCRDDEPILEAAEAIGLALPYSCRSAACATCAGRVLEGQVSLEDQYILGDGDLAAGYTLLCSAVPRGNCTVLTHQQKNVEGV